MKVAISGSSGLIGGALQKELAIRGYRIFRLVRREARTEEEIFFDLEKGIVDERALDGMGAVIHLAGESIGGRRWTELQKKKIRESRIKGTKLLVEAFARLHEKPEVFLCASALGYYGNRGTVAMDESAGQGRGFLADVCAEWEREAKKAQELQIRVVNLRFGLVLSSHALLFQKLLPPFRLGLGGIVGKGKQMMSWIALPDTVRAVIFALEHKDLNGPVNVSTPNPITNYSFTKTLGKILHRPTIFPLPAPLARLLFGEMADETLLASTCMVPGKLQEEGFIFLYPKLEETLQRVLRKEF